MAAIYNNLGVRSLTQVWLVVLSGEATTINKNGEGEPTTPDSHEFFLTRSYGGSPYSCNAFPLRTWGLALALARALLALLALGAHTDAFNTNTLWPP